MTVVKIEEKFHPSGGSPTAPACAGIHPSDPSDVEAPPPWGAGVFPPIFPFQIEFWVCTLPLPLKK